MEKEYVVNWGVAVTAQSPFEAACRGMLLLLRGKECATFTVNEVDSGKNFMVDLDHNPWGNKPWGNMPPNEPPKV